MTESIWRFIAKSWAPECFSLSSTITDTAHSTSVLVWPLRMTFGMGYRCYKTMASDSLQIRWTRWLWFYLTPSKTTMVLSKRLHTMVDNKWSLLTNRGKESSAMLANFPSKPSQNYFKPSKTECVRTPNTDTGRLNVNVSSTKISISSSILTRSWKFFFS